MGRVEWNDEGEPSGLTDEQLDEKVAKLRKQKEEM